VCLTLFVAANAADTDQPTQATPDAPSDSAIKQKLVGYWSSSRHAYLNKPNGISYMVSGTTTNQWNVKGGIYFLDAKPYDIVSLTDNTFVFRSRENSNLTFTLKRCMPSDIEQMKKYCGDWFKAHR